MNSCEEFQKLISVCLDEPLITKQQIKLDEHLTRCADCRTFQKSALNLRGLVRSLPFQSMAHPLRRPSPWWRRKIALPFPAVAAGILLIVASWLTHLSPTPSKRVESNIEAFTVIEQIDIIKLEPVSAVKLTSGN